MRPIIRFVVFVLVSFEFRKYFLLYPDFFPAPAPNLVAFQAEDGYPCSENRPEILLHDSGEVVEKTKAREVSQLDKASGTAGAAHHPRQDQDNGGETVDEEGDTDHFGGWAIAEEKV